MHLLNCQVRAHIFRVRRPPRRAPCCGLLIKRKVGWALGAIVDPKRVDAAISAVRLSLSARKRLLRAIDRLSAVRVCKVQGDGCHRARPSYRRARRDPLHSQCSKPMLRREPPRIRGVAKESRGPDGGGEPFALEDDRRGRRGSPRGRATGES